METKAIRVNRTNRKITFEQAKAQYVHRFTADHIPNWAKEQREDGTYYAPQYASDEEWYELTFFHGESPMAGKKHCYSTSPTWPYGKEIMDTPFHKGMVTKN